MNEKNGKVTWSQLIMIISIVGALIGALWTKLEKIDDITVEIKTDLAETKTDVGWLRGQFEKLSASAGSNVSVRPNLLDKMHQIR